MATHQKKALCQQAHLVLIDESGLLMAPLVKRTWAPRGQRPILQQKGKHREKVSLAVALALSPRRVRLKLLYSTLVNGYFNNENVVGFLEALMRDIPQRIVVLWDRGNMHKGDPIRAHVARFRPRMSLEMLPPWAPMLDPVEPIFSWLKYGRLSNYAPANAHELNDRIHAELDDIRDDQESLFNFWHESDLPLPKPLF
jgi:transposase